MQRGDRLKRRSSAADDTSSCGYSETEQIGAKGQHKEMNPSTSRSFGLKLLFPRKGWLKYFRKPQRGMSGTKAEKCEYHKHIYMYTSIFWLIILLKYLILPAIRAAIFIQKWYRQHQARQEMRKRCNWQIFQNLEYASEQDQSEVMNFDISKVERQLLRERFSYSYTSSSVTLWSTCHKLLGLETRQRSVRSHVWHFNRLCFFILLCN